MDRKSIVLRVIVVGVLISALCAIVADVYTLGIDCVYEWV